MTGYWMNIRCRLPFLFRPEFIMDENGYEDLSVNSPDICGRISMSSVLIYPPGMPVVNVGERITGDVCRIIKSAINAGLEVPGLKEGKIRCLR